jgi:hypothetical protein
MCEGYSSYDRFDLEINHIDGTIHEQRVSVNSGLIQVRLSRLCNGFRFRPDKKWFSDAKIIKVSSFGFTENEFHNFEKSIASLNNDLATLETKRQEIDEKVNAFNVIKAERTELDSLVGKAKAEYQQLTQSLGSVKESILKSQSHEKDLRQKKEITEESLRNLNAQLAKEGKRLDELVRELRLFPSEIAGFVKEGNRSIRTYVLIGIPFLAILVIILALVFFNAVNLTQLYQNSGNIDIWTIFLTRIPFVLIALALIEASGYIVGRLVFEIMRINRQRVEFAKLSIIAKDVSAAAAERSKGMTAQAVFNAETQLKMKLLREHMQNYVGNEFEYKGTGIIAAIKGVADRLSRNQSQ